MKYQAIFIILILILNNCISIPVAHKDCFTWELCDAIGCTDRHNCWLGHTVGGFGDCEDCNYPYHRGYDYKCFSKKTHYLECKCVSFANPKGCYSSTIQYAKISFESNFGINISTKTVKKKINLLDINSGSDFVNAIKNLCKVVDATKDSMDFLDNPLKFLIQENVHTAVEDLVKHVFRSTPLNKFEGISDYISIGINFALDKFLFNLRNLELRELDDSYFTQMLDFADQINQKRGIALIKDNGKDVFYDKDYFGYDDFKVSKIERKNLKSVSILIRGDVDKILSDSKWEDEKYFIEIQTKTNNEALNTVYSYEKVSLYAYDKEELVLSNCTKSSSVSNNTKNLKIKYYLLTGLIIIILI